MTAGFDGAGAAEKSQRLDTADLYFADITPTNSDDFGNHLLNFMRLPTRAGQPACYYTVRLRRID